MTRAANRLARESSPYLRQHAHNPVDWYPWGEEAFAAARRDDKPILLSVGYSACHWCHVMERESFEDEAIARQMNENFVNIKVDREERPDVDHIYMTAVQILTGRGGWPMTVFLTPDGRPFYGGTYFPPVDRHGMPGFPRVLEIIARKYREDPQDIQAAVHEIGDRLRSVEAVNGDGSLPTSDCAPAAAAALASAYDERHGGIGQAPKFPNTGALDLFLRAGHASGDSRYTAMALHTLRQMACGGIYDQLGGGFHRYSVDERWLVPHFEKMLYDNAQLVPLYLSAYQISGDAFFARIARETLAYVTREMRDPQGGFYSTQDADSEGVEGKFFVWERGEVDALLGDDAEIACRVWDITEEGNFEGRNILHVTLDLAQAARLFRRPAEEIAAVLERARDILFAARRSRIAPARDDKMLTSWNGLMISAFARAAEVLGDDSYAETARDAVAFIDRTLRRGDRLFATCKDGLAKLNGYLDDYAFYAAAMIDLYEALQDPADLTSARRLADAMIDHFWDTESAGFFFTSDDHEELIVRSKPSFDGSIPSGNAVATMTLLRLHHHTGESRYLERAEAVLRLYSRAAANQPFAMANLIAAADFHARGPREITVVSSTPGDDPLLRRLRACYIPNRVLSVITPERCATAPPLLAGKKQIGGRTTVYVCHRQTCSAPATEWATVEPLLTA